MEYDYIALNNHADLTLRSYYSTSKALTPIILKEFHTMLFEAQADESTFEAALTTYRRKVNSDFPPKAYDLLPYIESTQKVVDPTNTNSTLSDFADKVARMGWEQAVIEMHWTVEGREWISNMNTEVRYSCFPGWYQEYLHILHSGSIIESVEYFIANTGKKDKRELHKQLERYKIMGNETCKTYYPYFRKKVKPISFKRNPLRRV